MSDDVLRPRAYTVQSFERLFGIGHTKTYELIKDGLLRTVKVGRRRLIDADSAEALIKGRPGGSQ